MNVEIGTESAQFPEKEYINGIFVAVCRHKLGWLIKLSNFKNILKSYYNV